MIYVREFEYMSEGKRVVAYPVGMEGATEGYDLYDAIDMAADWLRETALDALAAGGDIGRVELGSKPSRGGTVIAVAVEASLEDIPAMTSAEAARTLGVSTARVAQLCKAGKLDSWKVGGTRMVSRESVELREESDHPAGRPREAVAG